MSYKDVYLNLILKAKIKFSKLVKQALIKPSFPDQHKESLLLS